MPNKDCVSPNEAYNIMLNAGIRTSQATVDVVKLQRVYSQSIPKSAVEKSISTRKENNKMYERMDSNDG